MILATVACGALLVAPLGAEEAPAQRELPEVFAMLATVLTRGADMGPGEGWFRPGESRYGWTWLSSRLDRDRDGEITDAEWRENDAAFFARLDRDRSGAVTAEDFDWSERSEYLSGRRTTRRLMSKLDTDSNGRVSPEEWAALYPSLAGDKGFVTADNLADWIVPPANTGGGPPPGAMPSKWTLLKALFAGELGSFQEGPPLDREAPSFSLSTHDRSRTISLAEFKGKRPVVLIFGSFT